MIDHSRQPVAIDDRPDADPLVWLGWIVDNYPHVTEAGQAVLIDGTLLDRLYGGQSEPAETNIGWIAWNMVRCARHADKYPARPTILVAITPEGRVPFEAPVPAPQRLKDCRTFWTGPDVATLVEELRSCA